MNNHVLSVFDLKSLEYSYLSSMKPMVHVWRLRVNDLFHRVLMLYSCWLEFLLGICLTFDELWLKLLEKLSHQASYMPWPCNGKKVFSCDYMCLKA